MLLLMAVVLYACSPADNSVNQPTATEVTDYSGAGDSASVPASEATDTTPAEDSDTQQTSSPASEPESADGTQQATEGDSSVAEVEIDFGDLM